MELKILGTLVIVLLALAIVIPVLKSKMEVQNGYWSKILVFTFLSFAALVALGFYNLFFYACIITMLVLLVRWITQELSNPKYGSLILGLYFGLWLSLPVGVYNYGT